jgi:hypothetical protein
MADSGAFELDAKLNITESTCYSPQAGERSDSRGRIATHLI